MKLPNLEAAVVQRKKITGYLLNAQHPDGAGKARFFATLGFHAERWDSLATALRRLAAENEVTQTVESAHGRKYIIDGAIESPDGQSSTVRTVWIVDLGQTAPRLVTAYPLEEAADDSGT